MRTKLHNTTLQVFLRYVVDCNPSGTTAEQQADVIFMNQYKRMPAMVMKMTNSMSDWMRDEAKFRARTLGLFNAMRKSPSVRPETVYTHTVLRKNTRACSSGRAP